MAGPSTKMTQRRGRTEKFGRDKSTWLSGGRLRIQHWQWDWRAFHDFHWPFRLLLRFKWNYFYSRLFSIFKVPDIPNAQQF